jgi:bifunctional DNA-binding transcriptional regulator/antitoxin component of YhaV-PrlF toxin-antitoxin module
MIEKKIQKKEEFYIEFTNDELETLNLKHGSKLSCKINDDKSVSLIPYKTIDLDLNEFSKENLIFMIQESVKNDQTIEEYIEQLLTEAIEKYEISGNNIKQ